ncbi:hypothetical protein F5148DRAFT_1295778, partial [Russula earlei]
NSVVANRGGAIYAAAALTVINCTFFNNTAAIRGGAIFANTALTVVNCVFVGNTAGTAGPDIYENYATTAPSGISYSYLSSAVTGTGNIQSTSNPFTDSAHPAGADGIWGTTDDGLHIAQTSTAYNAGSNTALPAGDSIDVAGNPRIAGGIVEMGAYEYHALALPLTLTSFTATPATGNVLLNWQTANEINTAQFNIQRSTDGSNFITLSKEAAIGAGNNSYSYTDDLVTLMPSVPVVYYRLQMVDKDGSSTYSQVASVVLSQAHTSFTITPNPAKDVVYINSNNATEVKIIDNAGRVVISQLLNNTDHTGITIASLSKGLYIVQVRDNKNNVQTGKLVIQ